MSWGVEKGYRNFDIKNRIKLEISINHQMVNLNVLELMQLTCIKE